MKILFITNEIPFPPDNGIRIVSYNAMRLMKLAGHELSIAVLTEENSEDFEERIAKILDICHQPTSLIMQLPRRNKYLVQLKAMLAGRLYFIERYRYKNFSIQLREIIKRFEPDVIHYDVITMLQYLKVAPKSIGSVASINDSYSLTLLNSIQFEKYSLMESFYRRIQYFHCLIYERFFYPKFNLVHIMSEIDQDFLKRLNPKINTVVIPNGVEDSLLRLNNSTLLASKRVVFVAKLVGENLVNLNEFIKRVWPKVIDQIPDMKLRIVGQITKDAQQLADQYDGVFGIQFVGYQKALIDAYENCAIAIVPIMKTCGIINKAIEAMAAGLAVVGFRNAFLGLKDAYPDIHFSAVENHEEMALKIIHLSQDSEERSRLGNNAHILIKEKYSWMSRLTSYNRMYERASINAQNKNPAHQ